MKTRQKPNHPRSEQLRLYQATFEMAPVAIAHVGLDGRWLRFNDALMAMTGYSREELQRRTFSDITHPEDIQNDWAKAKRLLAGEIPRYSMEKRYLRKGGEPVWARLSVSLVRNESGAPLFFIAVIEDIQAQKEAEVALRRRELWLAEQGRLLELSYDAIFVRDTHNRINFWNCGAHELYGWAAEDALGQDPHQLLHTEFPQPLESIHRQLEQTGRWEGELVHTRRDGARVVVTSRWAREVETGRVLEINRDITERKRATEALVRSKEDLERQVQDRTATLRETVSELEHFSYTLSHDMRAPLRAMQALSAILLEEASAHLGPEHQDYLQRIGAAARRMDNLITDALQYSLVLRGKYEVEPVDPSALLREMIGSYPQFQPPAVAIEFAPDMPPVLASRAGLTQCFSNLLANAAKFVTPGTKPRIRIWAEPVEAPSRRTPKLKSNAKFMRIWIEDNGIGIAQEHQVKIWDMFQRLNRDYEGTGIGLALVRKAVERMGGRVGVESEAGRGSRFWLELRQAHDA